MSGRKRTVQIKFYVKEEKRDLIAEKMKLTYPEHGGVFSENRH